MGGFNGPVYPSGRVLAQSAQAVTLTGSTGETTLASLTIPAGTLKTDGGLLVFTQWTMTGSTNAKTKRIKLGSTSFLNLATTTNTILTYARDLHILARGRSSQISMGATITGGAVGQQSIAATTGTENLDSDLTLAITGQLASAGESLVLEAYRVTLFNP